MKINETKIKKIKSDGKDYPADWAQERINNFLYSHCINNIGDWKGSFEIEIKITRTLKNKGEQQ